MIKRLKSIVFALLPIVLVVVSIHLFVYRFSDSIFYNFLFACVIFALGQVLFLEGIDRSIEPMGEYVGNSVDSLKRLYIYVIFAFVFGLLSTLAEPDTQVFALEVQDAGYNISKNVLIFSLGGGVGLFFAFGLLRILSNISINTMLIASFSILFILGIFVPSDFFAMALDAGCVTTGIVTSPFLLAMGIGVSKLKQNSKTEDGFGLLALCSVGAMIVTVIIGIVTFGSNGQVAVSDSYDYGLFLKTLIDVTMSLLPLILIFFIFEAFFIKISIQAKLKLVVGSLIAFVGFYFFLFSIEFGFVEMGKSLGKFFSEKDNFVIVCLVCSLFGFFVVFCEPSIRVLAEQVEEVTNKNIRSKLVLITVAISILVSTILCILKIKYQINIWYFVGAIFVLSFILMFIIPKEFSAIAYDSGGVATGSLTVAFIFPIMIGLATSAKDSFGVMAIISISSILALQILGLIYKIVLNIDNSKNTKILLKLSKTEDIYSDMSKLKKIHESKYREDYDE